MLRTFIRFARYEKIALEPCYGHEVARQSRDYAIALARSRDPWQFKTSPSDLVIVQ